ncbi:MAG TPA: VOC family protein [Acidobacteriaceae bacterium]
MLHPRSLIPSASLLASLCLGLGPARSHPAAHPSHPVLIHTCLITSDVDRLVAFYEPVLGIRAERSGTDYAEFHTGAGVLAIFSDKAQQKYIPDSAIGASNRSLVLEFRVSDVDGEYARLRKVVSHWVKSPTTQPWGTRSFYFRDPDGNLVDFYRPAAAGQAGA